MQHDETADNITPLIIRDIVVVAYGSKSDVPAGEYSPPGKYGGNEIDENETPDALIERLYKHIEGLVSVASEQHRNENCVEDRSQLDSSAKNNITRLVTNEFCFYTKHPLTIPQFQALQNKIADLAKKQPENLHLMLATFAVMTPDNKVMNVVANIACGQNPSMHFAVKNIPSSHDPVYKVKEQSNPDQLLILENINKKTDPDISNIEPMIINNQKHYFSYNNIFECTSAGGIRFYSCSEICLDHNFGVAKQNLENEILTAIDKAAKAKDFKLIPEFFKLIPKFFSHVVVSNTTDLTPNNCIGEVTQADTNKHSQCKSNKYAKQGIAKAAARQTNENLTFGTPVNIIVTENSKCFERFEISNMAYYMEDYLTKAAYLGSKWSA